MNCEYWKLSWLYLKVRSTFLWECAGEKRAVIGDKRRRTQAFKRDCFSRQCWMRVKLHRAADPQNCRNAWAL